MRNNGHVTNREVPVQPKEEIVSSTDTQGKLTYCNETFCKISGYSLDELIGQPHNILRHPDMPAEAFAQLWQALKQGKPWLGMVKNRCKNGDYYWVSAYVTPVGKHGTTHGYESVRVRADAEVTKRAEAAYKRLNAGKSACPPLTALYQRNQTALFITLALLLVTTIYGLLTAHQLQSYIAGGVLSVFAGALAQWGHKITLKSALERAHASHYDPVATYIYTGRADDTGDVELAQIALAARLRTALGRFQESAADLKSQAISAQQQADTTLHRMAKQQTETTHVAHAMSQMSQAVQEIAQGASDTSISTQEAIKEVDRGNQVIEHANNAINELSSTVTSLNNVMTRLTEGSGKIANVAEVIRAVAEQTNLLALNAAIEAARAGEQGRGFAVVADEVRTLAQRTQHSTEDIQAIIGELSQSTQLAGDNMTRCQNLVDRSVSEMVNVSDALAAITGAVNAIDSLSQQIAAAAEEQSVTAADIDNNTRTIIQISDETKSVTEATSRANKSMAESAGQQFELVERFS
ncbi:methyl-accepting chemotaxis protein [Gilvimarinus polysaccharolyticus]|uniref:methyl-accepting chemotaxis protein n=1 Tax=Gilvimarinus polysaccharolyticus TaxID=863921 RepID=UPI00067350AC|nr:PAS domain-containing methyl-accepting chemotaxis protein [Gilvimarinus polysaccharolyticus]